MSYNQLLNLPSSNIQTNESRYEEIIKEFYNNKSVSDIKISPYLSHQSSDVEKNPKVNSKLTEALSINSDGHEEKAVSSSPVLARSKSITSLATLIHIQPDDTCYEDIIKEFYKNKSVSEALSINSDGHRKRKFNESSLPKIKKIKLGSSSTTSDTPSIEEFLRPRTQICDATVEENLINIIQGSYKKME
ncbi:uncharacterized protein KGF55_000022 [Candida pseudojiufengensis]|uniref:uncharacterized protein n=1 Tax=Candida pseudojiufengensis TaxID=497109 RepID=UPI0022258DB1|nr:uncharacterized protein KGF55_000022 [Candida pseudojiufengensis]KAI5968152.1 hypothetical protein KGF55_000022 [Candida pseudojiufengensis]